MGNLESVVGQRLALNTIPVLVPLEQIVMGRNIVIVVTLLADHL